MEREATRLTTRYPLPDNMGVGIAKWEVGKKRMNPDNKLDIVTHILLKEDLVIITYRDFGEEGVSKNHIDTIEFRDAEYDGKNYKSGPVNSSELKKALNQGSK